MTTKTSAMDETEMPDAPLAMSRAMPTSSSLIPSRQDMNTLREIANSIIEARIPLPPSCATPQAVFVKMLYGREMGYTPMVSLYQIDFIEGKPTIPPRLMIAEVEKRGIGKIRLVKSTEEEGTVEAWRTDRPDEKHLFTWTMERAKRAGFSHTQDGRIKKNWKNSAAMLLARATAEAWRALFSELSSGIGYTAAEFDVEIDDDGRFVDVAGESSLVDMAEVTGIKLKPAVQDAASEAAPAAAGPAGEGVKEAGEQKPVSAATSDKMDTALPPPAAGTDATPATTGDHRSRLLSEIQILVTQILKLFPEDWQQIKNHWKPADRQMNLDEITKLRQHLGVLAMLNWLCGELAIPADAWKTALERRGALKLADLSDVSASELYDKLAARVVPFKRDEMLAEIDKVCGAVESAETGGPGGN